MSRTHKTSRFRAARQQTADVVEKVLGERMDYRRLPIEMRSLIHSDHDYHPADPVRSGSRYGNQRHMRAALKVSGRRRDRRENNRIADGE